MPRSVTGIPRTRHVLLGGRSVTAPGLLFACSPLQSVRPRSIMRSLLVFPKTPSAAPHVSALSLALPI